MEVNDKKMNTTDDFDEVVKATNASKDPVLWIKAKNQAGQYKIFTVDLSEDTKK